MGGVMAERPMGWVCLGIGFTSPLGGWRATGERIAGPASCVEMVL